MKAIAVLALLLSACASDIPEPDTWFPDERRPVVTDGGADAGCYAVVDGGALDEPAPAHTCLNAWR